MKKNKGELVDMRRSKKSDLVLTFSVIALVVAGLISIASASSVRGFENFNDPYYYFKHQLFYGVIVGIIAMFVVSNINYLIFKKLGKWCLFGSVFLLLLVFIPGIGTSYGTGSNSWINIGFSIQPTEIVKLLFIIYLAAWLEKMGKDLADFKKGLLSFIFALGIIAVLIMLQPDLGTLIIIACTAIAMFFMGGAPSKYIALILGGATAFFAFMVKIAPYRLARFTVFLHPELDPQGIGYQVNQALLAVGSGGVFGLGLGHSRQKFNYLPEASGDSIFAIMSEELGLLRIIVVLALFAIFIWRGFRIASNTKDRFGKFLAIGITSWITIQAFMNIGAILSLIPLTGIPLPFISYGGSSVIFSLVGVGILMNIAKQNNDQLRKNVVHLGARKRRSRVMI